MSNGTWIAIENARRTCIPGRVVLELLVDEPLELGEADDLVEPLVDLLRRQAEQRAVDADVVACVEIRVEADAELDERREPAVDADGAGVGAVDAGEDLQQRALAAAVRADDAEALAVRRREADVVERVVLLVVELAERVEEELLDRRLPLVRQQERLRDVLDLDRRAPSHALREPRRLAPEEPQPERRA